MLCTSQRVSPSTSWGSSSSALWFCGGGVVTECLSNSSPKALATNISVYLTRSNGQVLEVYKNKLKKY